MNEQMRKDLTPQGYIRHMFAETENGEFKVWYENPENDFAKEERTFRVNWTAEDAEEIVQRYNLLTSALARIGRLHNQLTDEESRKNLLSKEDLEIYNMYVYPYEQSQEISDLNCGSDAKLILRAARYEKLISLGAPEIVVTEEGRLLAEEMVLYYFGK